MKDIVLNIYKNNEIIKTYKAHECDLEMGTIESLMDLLELDKNENQFDILKKVTKAWKEIKNVLKVVFPECSADEWEHVKIKDVLNICIQIARYTMSTIFEIPAEKN